MHAGVLRGNADLKNLGLGLCSWALLQWFKFQSCPLQGAREVPLSNSGLREAKHHLGGKVLWGILDPQYRNRSVHGGACSHQNGNSLSASARDYKAHHICTGLKKYDLIIFYV